MIQSVIVYSLLMGTMLLCVVYTAKKNNFFYMTSSGITKQRNFWSFEIIFPLLLFAIVFGMRYDVGTDHLHYLKAYVTKGSVSKGEPLFDLLSDIGWKLNLHVTVYFGIIAFIQVYFFFYAFKDERYLYPFLVFFLFTNGDWGFWMNGIRQALAMCVWIFSIKYIEEKAPFKYLLWCAIAILFHWSAAVVVFFYPILRNGRDYFKNVPFQLILLVSAFVIKALFSGIIVRLEPIIDSYTNLIGGGAYSGYDLDTLEGSFVESGGTGLVYAFRIILNIVIILYSTKLKSFYDSKRFTIIYFFFIIGLLTFYMFPVGLISVTRPFRYFYIFQSIMYAYFIHYLYNTKLKNTTYGSSHAMMYYGLIAIFLGIFYLSQISSNEEAHSWYQFFFDQNINGYPK